MMFVAAPNPLESSYMLFSKRKRHVARILIVEDEPLVAFDNESSLTADGYEVVATVDNAAAAAEIIDAQVLDLILTDMSLAGEGDGMDVARHAASKSVPVLFVSGVSPPEARGLAIGCLLKPYNARSLKGALDYVDRMLGGQKPGKLPPGLRIYGNADEV